MQQSSVVCCQDHNYGAPPPPTPPSSPLSQTIIPRMDLNGVARGPRYHEVTEENSADSDSSSEEDGAVSGWCHCSLTADNLLIKCEHCRSDVTPVSYFGYTPTQERNTFSSGLMTDAAELQFVCSQVNSFAFGLGL